MTISRPRLLPHVLPRRQIVHGTSAPEASSSFIVLFDTDRMHNHRVGPRTWLVLSAMDGTRDVDGLVAFATAQGAAASREEVVDLIADLASQGMIGEGVEASIAPSELRPSEPAPRPRTLQQLPGYRLDCDGRGTCCRFYPSIAFSTLDAARARAARPDVLGGGEEPSRVFLPLLGSDARSFAVALSDGRCSYLEHDLGCGIHRAAGAQTKPLGCRTYPARFVDDGEHVRVSPWPECACVFSSAAAGPERGEPLLDPTTSSVADLDPAFHIERLPAQILYTLNASADRAAYVAWADALYEVPIVDGVRSLAALSDCVASHGLDHERARAALSAPAPPDVERFVAAAAAAAGVIQRLADEDWRGAADMVRVTATALVSAAALVEQLAAELLSGPGQYAASERFYVRNLLFGHHAVDKHGRRPLDVLLFDRALRALLGRALGVVAGVAELRDPAFQEPLSLVEATMRGYGVRAYLASG